jgi:hypothetical protein
VVEATDAGPASSLFVVRALEVGEAPGFDVHVTPVDRLAASDVAAAAVVILNDTPPPTAAAGRALEESVRAGTGLLVALGPHAAWRDGGADLLPGVLGDATDRSAGYGGTLGFIDYSHPVFEIFKTPHSGDLTAARILQYRQLKPGPGLKPGAYDTSDQVLARYDDGAVALAERRVGRGLVLAWTSTLDSDWNDLALKPVFVPFVQEAVKHLARYAQHKPWNSVGEILDAAAAAPPGAAAAEVAAGAFTVVTPGGRRETAAAAEQPAGLP